MNKSLDLLQLPEFMDLSPRDRGLVLALLSGLSNADAMRQAGYAESTIKARSGNICSRSRIQSVISAAMTRAGITPEHIAARLREGIDQTDTDRANLMNSRHRYIETAVRLSGFEPSREVDISESYEDRILRIKGEIESNDDN